MTSVDEIAQCIRETDPMSLKNGWLQTSHATYSRVEDVAKLIFERDQRDHEKLNYFFSLVEEGEKRGKFF